MYLFTCVFLEKCIFANENFRRYFEARVFANLDETCFNFSMVVSAKFMTLNKGFLLFLLEKFDYGYNDHNSRHSGIPIW